MSKVILTTATGELESTFDPPYSLREQLAWEEHFRGSFFAVESAVEEAQKRARGEDIDPAKYLRTSWVMFFAWHRLRPKVPAKFETFLDTVEEWRVEATEEELARIAELTAAAGQPTPEADLEPAGSGLDPTPSPPTPTDRAAPPT